MSKVILTTFSKIRRHIMRNTNNIGISHHRSPNLWESFQKHFEKNTKIGFFMNVKIFLETKPTCLKHVPHHSWSITIWLRLLLGQTHGMAPFGPTNLFWGKMVIFWTSHLLFSTPNNVCSKMCQSLEMTLDKFFKTMCFRVPYWAYNYILIILGWNGAI